MQKFELYHPIYTDHFVLDWLTTSKLRDVYMLRNNAEVAAASGRDLDDTLKETTDYVNNMMRLVMNNQSLMWSVSDKESHQFLGTFCIWNFNDDKTSAEVGFEILPDQQNHGIMHEVLIRMISFAFDELELTDVRGLTLPNNEVSQHLLKKAGFQLEADSPNPDYLSFHIQRD